MFSERMFRTIGEASAPEAWRYAGSMRSLLSDSIEFTYQVCTAGESFVVVTVPAALGRIGDVIPAVVSLRREIERRAARMYA